MELKINNQTKQFDAENLTVQALIDLEIPENQNGIALAINQTVIPKSNWNTHLIKATDEILIITATQGGWFGRDPICKRRYSTHPLERAFYKCGRAIRATSVASFYPSRKKNKPFSKK